MLRAGRDPSPRDRGRIAFGALAFALIGSIGLALTAPQRARAQEEARRELITAGVEALILHGVDTVGARALGFGGGVTAFAELNLDPAFGVIAGVDVWLLADNNGAAPWISAGLGGRFHFGSLLRLNRSDAWLDAVYMIGQSGSITAHAFQFALAYELPVSRDLRIGPMARLFVPVSPEVGNPTILALGISIGFGGNARSDPAEFDTDGDGVRDPIDVCPDVSAGYDPDTVREGCPANAIIVTHVGAAEREEARAREARRARDPGAQIEGATIGAMLDSAERRRAAETTQGQTPMTSERRRIEERRRGLDVSATGRPVLAPGLELAFVAAAPGAHAVGTGAGVTLTVEANLLPELGVVAGANVLAIGISNYREVVTWIGVNAGLRAHFGPAIASLPREDDLWLDARYIFGQSGNIASHGASATLAYEFGVLSGFRIGPMARVEWLAGPGLNGPVFIELGASFGFGANARVGSHTLDEDGDGVSDAYDECRDAPVGRQEDPRRRGCPSGDTDGDGFPDSDDFCPNEARPDRWDPGRPGCPPPDSDGDGVSDIDDICPGIFAANGGDPLREGCPVED